MPDSPPIDFDLALRCCFGRRELLHKLMHKFVHDLSDLGHGIERALASGQTDTAARLTHALVSMAGSLGAPTLSSLARTLHQQITDRTDPARLSAKALIAEHERVVQAARTWLAQQPSPPSNAR